MAYLLLSLMTECVLFVNKKEIKKKRCQNEINKWRYLSKSKIKMLGLFQKTAKTTTTTLSVPWVYIWVHQCSWSSIMYCVLCVVPQLLLPKCPLEKLKTKMNTDTSIEATSNTGYPLACATSEYAPLPKVKQSPTLLTSEHIMIGMIKWPLSWENELCWQDKPPTSSLLADPHDLEPKALAKDRGHVG